MRNRSMLTLLASGLVAAGAMAVLGAQQQAAQTAARQAADRVAIDPDDVGGVVTSANGPEAGVWVIAETTELPTRFRRIVVTDDQGRFVLPDLPKSSYRVWVRGYGLVDSGAVIAAPGEHVALAATTAPNTRAAAQYYPSNYWLSLLQVPAKSEFPITLPAGAAGANPVIIESQARWVATLKGCEICHQMGNKPTREFSPAMGVFDSSFAAWDHRIRMGQVGSAMVRIVNGIGHDRTMAALADWTDRITAGEVPQAPPRPQGVERNVVVTLWDIGTPLSFMHDMYATDKRDPSVNGGGAVYAGDYNQGILSVLDPRRNTVESIKVPVRDRNLPPSNFAQPTMEVPSLFWGEELIWNETQRTEVKNVDAKGRLWMMTTFRLPENPAWCKEGSTNKFAQYFPIARSTRQLAYYDPKTKQTTLIDTCFNTHHAAYAEDADDTIFVSGQGTGLSWFKASVFERTGDAQAAQGWCPAYYDVNGNGRYDKDGDKLIATNDYYITFNPKDGSVWYASPSTPGLVVRVDIGANPPETCRAEAYAPPFNNPKAPGQMGFLPRGIDVDRNGLIWAGLAGSGQLASFDRSKCAVLTGPASFDPQHCPEGWALYDVPGPQMKNITDGGSADFLYGNWVDQFDTLGLGKNVPIATGTGSDALLAFLPDTKKWVVMRVPYPLGFYTRNLAGRIDNPNTGWKGKGLWAGNEVRMPWHIEGGKGTTPQAAHFQVRPDPLAH